MSSSLTFRTRAAQFVINNVTAEENVAGVFPESGKPRRGSSTVTMHTSHREVI